MADGHSQRSTLVPSPVATGGAGEDFERQLAAFALTLLLARSTAPVLGDAAVVQVHLQTRHLGWCTDDLLIVAETHPGATRKLAIQAKRSFTVSASDEDCAATIRGMWDDFHAAARFDEATDRLGVATLHGTATLLRDFSSLLACARAAGSAEDFGRRVAPGGYLSQTARRQHEALRVILRAHLDAEPDDDAYWRFLRVLTVLSYDFGTPTAQSEVMALALLAHVADGVPNPQASARATWAALLEVAAEGRQAAASFTRDALPAPLRAHTRVVPTSDERARMDLVAHGRTVRDAIRTTIARTHTIERGEPLDALRVALEQGPVAVVTGGAGSGKSALAKAYLDHVEPDRPVLAFQAVEFATPHLNDTLARTQTGVNAQTLPALLAAHDRTTVLVESVERLLEHDVRDAFAQLLQLAAATPTLRLVLTCRDYSLETVRSALLAPTGLAHAVVEVGPLADRELAAVADAVPALAVPLADSAMRGLLRTPYLLDVASQLDWTGAALPNSVRAFREKCWREVVRDDARRAGGMPARREAAFIDVARRRAAELRPYVRAGGDAEALAALREASLLEPAPGSDALYAPAHDVLEDWAVLKWLDDQTAASDDPAAALASAVGGLPALRRGLRRWLGEQLEVDPLGTVALVLGASVREDLPAHFRDDCVVAALLSDAAAAFVDGCRRRVEAGDVALLRRLVQMARVACKAAPAWLPSGLVGSLGSSWLVPAGPGWPPLLTLVTDHLPAASGPDALLYLGLVEDWSRQVTISAPAPAGAGAAGRIASGLLALFDGYPFEELRKRALGVVLKLPQDAPAFADLAPRALRPRREDRLADEFADLAVATLTSAFAARDVPGTVTDILRARLLLQRVSKGSLNDYSAASDVDECFGFRSHLRGDFFPASALQGPFHTLFQHHPRLALDFVLEMANHAGTWYGERRWPGHDLERAERLTIDVPGHGPVEQWANWRLYGLYRGMTVGPYPLQSALMALETWLLRMATSESAPLEDWLLHALRSSNNVAVTAVVASVCIAHPARAGRAALAVLSHHDLVADDRARMAHESHASVELLTGLNPAHGIYENERKTANALQHRREDLEALAIRLQFTPLRDDVWALIDRHRAAAADGGDEEAQLWRLALHRMDVRGFRVADEQPPASEATTAQGRLVAVTTGALEPDLQQIVNANGERMRVVNRHLRLQQRAHAAWENRTGPEAAEWRDLLSEAQRLAQEDAGMERWVRGGPGLTAAICLRDRLTALTPDALAWCVAQVARELTEQARGDDEPESAHSRLFGPDRAAAAVLPLVAARVPDLLPDAVDLLAHTLAHRVIETADYAYSGAGAFLGRGDDDLALRCAAAAVGAAEVEERVRADARRRQMRRYKTGADMEADEEQTATDVAAEVRTAARRALTEDVERARVTIARIDLGTWAGRRAARRLFSVLQSRADLPEARALGARVAAWLAETWARRQGEQADADRDIAGALELCRRLAVLVLRLPAVTAREICAPLVALAPREPREVATFVSDLVVAADGKAGDAEDSFWPLWQAFADEFAGAIVGSGTAARLDREHPWEAPMIDRLFLAQSWKSETTHWARLEGHAHRVHTLAARLPAAPVCVRAYARFLYTIGRRELPGALVSLDAVVQRGDAARLMTDADVAFYVEGLLGQFVYAEPLRVKRDPALRSAILRLLDALVAAGSSAAYRMRDDFVTPARPVAA